MASVATYLNFANRTEEAFLFYKEVFGGEFTALQRFKDIPAQPGMPGLPPGVEDKLMHVSLPILGGHVLMGTDACPEMGFNLTMGDNVHISLAPDSREEAERLFASLSAGGSVEMPLSEQFWGALFGSCTDRFGVKWMVNLPL